MPHRIGARALAARTGATGLMALAVTLAGGAAAQTGADPPPPADGFIAYSGSATLRQVSRFVYGERHVLEYRSGALVRRVVLYTCADGAPFARKIVDYVDPTAPDFELDDTSSGLREGVRSGAAGRTVFFRQNANAAEKTAPLPVGSARSGLAKSGLAKSGLAKSGLIIDAGFDEFVRGNWTRLLSGEPLQFRFLVPSRLEAIDFQVQHLRSDARLGRPAEIFRLKLSGLLGWVLPSIDVAYAATDRVLLSYDGISDLRDADDDNFKVSIRFPPDDRLPSSAAAMRAARTARLAPCR